MCVCSLTETVTGVKEAFLKVAQGVISLHQHNQLHRDMSPVDSYTQQTVSRTFNPLPDPTDNVHVHHTGNAATNDGMLARCCS